MIIPKDDMNVIRSLANEFIRNLPKPKDYDTEEFVTLCWLKALKLRYPDLDLELP